MVRLAAVLVGAILVAGCHSKQESQQKSSAWKYGNSVSADGSQLQILCYSGEWTITIKTIERLVPPDAKSQWMNRVVTFQFDKEPVQRTKGTLNESRLDFNQTPEGGGPDLYYGQDISAGILSGKHKTLLLTTTDGSDRSKEWRFDIVGAREVIGDQSNRGCMMPPAPAAAKQ